MATKTNRRKQRRYRITDEDDDDNYDNDNSQNKVDVDGSAVGKYGGVLASLNNKPTSSSGKNSAKQTTTMIKTPQRS